MVIQNGSYISSGDATDGVALPNDYELSTITIIKWVNTQLGGLGVRLW